MRRKFPLSLHEVLGASLAATLLIPSAVQAASVLNRDSVDHTITVVEGSAVKDHVLKPNAVLSGICESGCVVRLNGDDVDPYELEGPEVTSIEGGELYDDGVGPSRSSDLGDAVQPSEPRAKP